LYHFGPGNALLSAGSVSETISAVTGSETMSEAEFAAFQSSLRGAAPAGSAESIIQEGLLPSLSDHKMDRYLGKILSQLK
jgi:hypothetical protein